MECSKYRRMVSRELDGEIDAAGKSDLEGHLASCERCRSFRATSREAFSIHRAAVTAVPPPQLVGSILAAVESRPRMGWIGARLGFAMSAATVAVAALGFWIGAAVHESYVPKVAAISTDVLELSYLDEYPPGSFGDILTASFEGGGDE